jgi:hypothetical protein
MTDEQSERVLTESKRQLAALVDEAWPQILDAMGEAAIEASRQEKERFTFKVGCGLDIEPRGNATRVEASIAWGVRRRVTTLPVLVSEQGELFNAATEGGTNEA